MSAPNTPVACDPCTVPSEGNCKFVKQTKESREQIREYEHVHTVEEHVIHKPKCEVRYVTFHHQAPCEKSVVGCPCRCPDSLNGYVRDGCAPHTVGVPAAAAAPVASNAGAAAVAEVVLTGQLPPGARINAEAVAAAVAPAQPPPQPVTHIVAQPAPQIIYVTQQQPVQRVLPATNAYAENPSTGYGYRWVPSGM